MPKLPDVTRTVEKFESQPPVVLYTAPAPVPLLNGLALQAELIVAGLPERVDVSAASDRVRVAILDDEANDRTQVVAQVIAVHNGHAHPKERSVPDVVTKGR